MLTRAAIDTAHSHPYYKVLCCARGSIRFVVAICIGLVGLVLNGASVAYAEAAVQVLASDDKGSASCGAARVSWNNVNSPDFTKPGSGQLRASLGDGTTVLDLNDALDGSERIIPLWCGDLLGDGSQALAFEWFTGGAHCCFSATIVLLQDGAPRVLQADLGNGGLKMPQQLDDGGALELPASSDVFAYFDSLTYAASPSMPLVFAFDGTHYVEATRRFPALIQAELESAEKELATAPPDDDVQESYALQLYGLHVLLGDADAAMPAIQARITQRAARWLAANAADARAAMAQVYSD